MDYRLSTCVFLLCFLQISSLCIGQSFFIDFLQNKKDGQMFQQQTQKPNIMIEQILTQTNVSQKYINLPINSQQQKNEIMEQILNYSSKFRKMKFNLQEQELQKLAYDVSDLYSKNKIALFFVSAYFLRACQILQYQHISPVQITSIIKKKIKVLMNLTSAQTYRSIQYGNSTFNKLDPYYWQQVERQIVEMTPKKFKLELQNKDQQIENIIMKMVAQAFDKYQIFHFLTTSICKLNNGLTCHLNFKIKNKTQIPQMKRVKQKLLRDYFKIYGDDFCLNTFLNLSSKRKIEQLGFENLLKRVYSGINQVQFVVKDILRAKCMFKQVNQIRSAALTLISIVRQMKEKGYDIKIVQFENRLAKTTCDIMLIIQIGQLPTQIQLSLDYDQSLFQISHKMYEISRSKVFSPIFLLFEWFQKIAPQFLYKLGLFLFQKQNQKAKFQIKKNYQNQSADYFQQLNHFSYLQKQYELLNKFFHITASYQDIYNISQSQFQREIQKEIVKQNYQTIQPFVLLETQM